MGVVSSNFFQHSVFCDFFHCLLSIPTLKVYPLRLGVFANFFNLDPLVRLVDTVFLSQFYTIGTQVTLSLATFFSLESIATEHLSFFSVVVRFQHIQ